MPGFDHFAEPPTPYWAGPNEDRPSEAEIVAAMRRQLRTESARTRALGVSLLGALAVLVATAAFIRTLSGPDVVFYLVVSGLLAAAALVAIARVYFAFARFADEIDAQDAAICGAASREDHARR
jgi:ABC-type siderophore export system fused ATPase/permease subunit